MISRVTQGTLFRELRRSVERIQRDIAAAQETISSQKRLREASTDPSGAARVNRLRADLSGLAAWRDGVGFGIAVLAAEDGAIDQAQTILTRAREIATQQASGLQTPASRQQAAAEVAELERGLLTLGNTQLGGRYVFGGLVSGPPPFAGLDDPGFDPTTAYGGTADTFSIRTGADQTVRLSTAGDDVFGAAIEAIDELRQTLAAGNAPVASLDDIETAAEVLREERASVGGRQARLEGRTEEIEASLVDTQKLLGSLEDADLTVSISELTQLQTALQATLATASTLQTSILDYFE
jgi:flagellar hook-associated protein 3 FlgL